MTTTLKARYLKYVGGLRMSHESASEAFDRYRAADPDFLPVPRCDQSMADAVLELVEHDEAIRARPICARSDRECQAMDPCGITL